ncbi:nuclear transport factor 2 family protein [Brevundimonas sp.]|uniref:nuclear transport factor 2 family protein n=1 Tax=Brevundimonas sp. TaxID=1871086 RepID=UPI0026335B58|nr:nuclear transport factor 2 family protein [Brevundimonas sp.]
MADRDPEVQALLDKKAIEEVLLKFLRGCDRNDADLVERAYWPDGWEDHGGTFDGPASEWVAVVKERLPKAGLMNHMAMNMVIDLKSATTATAECYILTASRPTVEGREFDARTLARCVDQMEKRGDEWRIFRRTLCWEWNEERELSETWARGAITRDPSVLRRGAKRPDDIIYTAA